MLWDRYSRKWVNTEMNKTVQLPSRGWDALLEILESHKAKHGEFDIVTIMELHKQIKEQTGIIIKAKV